MKKFFIAGLFTLLCHNTASFADSQVETNPTPLTGVYASVFGGGGSMMSGVSLVQLATALYDKDDGGPVAVNAKGSSNSSSFWLVGGNIGYNWFTKPVSSMGFNVSPSIELEGLYIGQHKIKGSHQNNKDASFTHIFKLTLPADTGVGLVNMVFDFCHQSCPKLHGYIGAGLGIGLTSISNAKAIQTTPPEPGINHFKGDSSDEGLSLAVQPKLGMLFDCSSRISLFAEYRFLYLSNSNYEFGSTTVPGHVATTSWLLKMGSQLMNIGVVGIRFKL